jgi:hypothetical protein
VLSPLYARELPSELKLEAPLTPDPQLNLPSDTAQLPFDDFKVKPLPDDVAVNPAQVPVVYQVPPDMMHPFLLPDVTTFRNPFPLNGAPLGVDEGPLLLEGAVLEGLSDRPDEVGLPPPPPDLGRYLIELPVQLESVKESAGTNSPVCKLPRTL